MVASPLHVNVEIRAGGAMVSASRKDFRSRFLIDRDVAPCGRSRSKGANRIRSKGTKRRPASRADSRPGCTFLQAASKPRYKSTTPFRHRSLTYLQSSAPPAPSSFLSIKKGEHVQSHLRTNNCELDRWRHHLGCPTQQNR